MQEPTTEVLEKISGTFEDFLDRNNLQILVPLVRSTNAAQGYGYINEIGALYGLMWNTPKFLISLCLRCIKIFQKINKKLKFRHYFYG